MKLYHHEGQWQIPGHQDKKASRIEVPTDSQGLCDWLNERAVQLMAVKPENLPAEHVEMPRAISGPAIQSDLSTARKSDFTATEIVEFVLDVATVAQVETIFATLGTRFAEARR